MQSWEALPAVLLRPSGVTAASFLARSVCDFRSAARYLHSLPYGRNTNRADFRLVLDEGRGTCSTKHALLAELAREQHIPAALTLGIYAMHERNTPGVGPILEKYALSFIPEAHCYLTYAKARIDITRSGVESGEPVTPFLHEETITPAQIGEYKVAIHQEFLRAWIGGGERAVGRTFEQIWRIREECIAALTQ
jgi:transglutaminase superfamily protein